jgi:hypothetical protein
MIVSAEREQRQQWLNSLKVGDEVAIIHSQYGRKNIRTSKIVKITPTRRFKIDGMDWCTFDNSGEQMGVGRWDMPNVMFPVTNSIKESLARTNTIHLIENFKKWHGLSTQQLLEILKIIEAK